jgi:hypothetical protein
MSFWCQQNVDAKSCYIRFGVNKRLMLKDIAAKMCYFLRQLIVDAMILSDMIYCITMRQPKGYAKNVFCNNFLSLASTKVDAKSDFSCSGSSGILTPN